MLACSWPSVLLSGRRKLGFQSEGAAIAFGGQHLIDEIDELFRRERFLRDGLPSNGHVVVAADEDGSRLWRMMLDDGGDAFAGRVAQHDIGDEERRLEPPGQ